MVEKVELSYQRIEDTAYFLNHFNRNMLMIELCLVYNCSLWLFSVRKLTHEAVEGIASRDLGSIISHLARVTLLSVMK